MRTHLTTPAGRMARLGHHARVFLLPALIVAAAPAIARADGNVILDVGMRSLDERTWDPLDNQVAEGLRFTYARSGWPVGLAFGWHTSDGEETRNEFVPDGGGGCFLLIFCYRTGDTVERTVARGSLRELSLGVDKDWVSKGSKARGFLGGGLTQVRASLDNRLAGFRDSDRSVGFWAHAGIVRSWELFDSSVQVESGVELRVLQGARLELGGERGDADYVQLGLISGIRWSR